VYARDGSQLHRLVVVSPGKGLRYRWIDVCAGSRGSLALCRGENLCSCGNRNLISRLFSLWSSHGSSSCLIRVVVFVVAAAVVGSGGDGDDNDKDSELDLVYDNVTRTELKKTLKRKMGSSFPWLITFRILSIILV
jgi:hypothetical protein